MNKVMTFLTVFVSLGCILMGMVFILALGAGVENLYIGVGMEVVGAIMVVLLLLDSRNKPEGRSDVEPGFDHRPGRSEGLGGSLYYCRTCGAPIGENDLKVVEDGLMFNCSRCGAVGMFEEVPVW